jgi:hypothetical protein
MGSKLEGGEPGKRSARDLDTSAYEQPQGQSDHGAENRALDRMPHERDESAEATGTRLDETPVPSGKHIRDAARDIDQGRKDTDRRGVPNDVPSRKSESSGRRGRGGPGV